MNTSIPIISLNFSVKEEIAQIVSSKFLTDDKYDMRLAIGKYLESIGLQEDATIEELFLFDDVKLDVYSKLDDLMSDLSSVRSIQSVADNIRTEFTGILRFEAAHNINAYTFSVKPLLEWERMFMSFYALKQGYNPQVSDLYFFMMYSENPYEELVDCDESYIMTAVREFAKGVCSYKLLTEVEAMLKEATNDNGFADPRKLIWSGTPAEFAQIMLTLQEEGYIEDGKRPLFAENLLNHFRILNEQDEKVSWKYLYNIMNDRSKQKLDHTKFMLKPSENYNKTPSKTIVKLG